MLDIIAALESDFQRGWQHQNAGQLGEAAKVFQEILRRQPNHAGALHHLGVIAAQTGKHDVALQLIGRATALNPYSATALNDLGVILQDVGRLEESEAACRRSVALDPAFANGHNTLGNALRRLHRTDEAIAEYRQAIELDPDFALGWTSLGCALAERRELDEAVVALRRAVTLEPRQMAALSNLGNILVEIGAFDEAIAMLRHAIELAPSTAVPRNNLANALWKVGQLDEGLTECRRAIELQPDMPSAYVNLGNLLKELHRFDEAEAAYRRAIAFAPAMALPHYNLAFLLLARGEFSEGWREYEWRWLYDRFPSRPPNYPQPLWDGSSFAGRTLLVRVEQGFGDCLQFVRYLPMVAERGGKIALECPTEFVRLFQSNFGQYASLVTANERMPAFDVHCPLLSLPRLFETTLTNVPNETPYLAAPADVQEAWRLRLADEVDGVRIGLAWAGRPTHPNDRHRSISPARLAPLFGIPGVCFLSLQKSPTSTDARNGQGELDVVDLTADLADFAETAGLIANLDLVITVDTAVAHLAGALGKPVWLLLPFVNTDWRWMLDRDDSVWYPTMRLYRQLTRGDWDSVVARVCGDLRLWIADRRVGQCS